MNSTAKLCEVCSKLNLRQLTHPVHPCGSSLPCNAPPTSSVGANSFLSLGSVDEIKRRRLTCDVCKLVAESLDNEPADLAGECRIKESIEFCNFTLPENVNVLDPSVTHFHLTQAIVIFDTSVADKYLGPSLPWDAKEWDTHTSHTILNLQVKAKSCVEARDSILFPEAEEDFLATIGGRYVSTQVDAQLIRTWFHRCESEHLNQCHHALKLPHDRDTQPAFVIDVARSCLVETPSQCRYVALSYVWGQARVFVHLAEGTQGLRRGGSLRSLPIPATIRDSMTLVDAIGERYLWVDSLCIIQDDLMMQQAEIARMTSIYSKALFTIIAAAGDHADSGLPGVRRGSRAQAQKILKLADCELLTVIDGTLSGIDGTAWAQRAWTFQERILSKRVLVFSENQVYWSCRAAAYSEERALEQVRDVTRLYPAFAQGLFFNSLSTQERLEISAYRYIYSNLLRAYRQRHLSYETDLLNAFNGISEILATCQNDRFLWGLPESLFTYALTWSFMGTVGRNHVEVPILQSNGSLQTVPFPSWSWAAWSGEDPDATPWLHPGDDHDVRPTTHFYIVDREHRLVKVNEELQDDRPRDSLRASWHQQPIPPPLLARNPPVRIGQLRFWTSFASNVRVVRSLKFEGQRGAKYRLLPPPDIQLYPNEEIAYHDFIVIAACGLIRWLIILAVEWKDGVAYRIASEEVREADWVRVENREWRWVVLG